MLDKEGRAYGGLQAGVDFRIVNAFIWDTFYRMYQGGPELLSGKFQAEVRVAKSAAPKYRSDDDVTAQAASELLSTLLFWEMAPPPSSGLSSLSAPPPPPNFASSSKSSEKSILDTVEFALQVGIFEPFTNFFSILQLITWTQGYVNKGKSLGVTGWDKRWFRLENGVLSWCSLSIATICFSVDSCAGILPKRTARFSTALTLQIASSV
jgi:hypothetical protein